MTPAFQNKVCRLHAMGPRPIGELLHEIGRAHGITQDIEKRLAQYVIVSADALDVTGGREFPPSPLHEVVA